MALFQKASKRENRASLTAKWVYASTTGFKENRPTTTDYLKEKWERTKVSDI